MQGYQQAFSTEEYKSRLARVWSAMDEKSIELLLLHSPENIYYLTGHQTSGYFAYQVLVVKPGEDPVLLLRYLEKGNVDEYSWLPDAETWREGDDVVNRTVEVVHAAGGRQARIGLEKSCWFLTASVSEALQRGLGEASFIDASLLVDRVRIIKSAAEIGYLRKAAAISELEQRAALEVIGAGVSEAEVAAAVYEAGVRAGCEYTGLPHHIMSGHRYGVCHANWGPKIIRRGELVLMELYGCIERYHATQMRTISIGPASDEAKAAAELVITAQDRAIEAMKPGASSREVDGIVRSELRKVRKDYYNRSGYSTGIGFPPRTAEWEALDFNEQSDWELQEGMVFHMLALAQNFGISETVLVTRTGAERLTYANPRELYAV